jgi:hypothetical protein
MKLTKGDRFKDYIGTPCFISYIKEDIVKLSFIECHPHVEVWDKQEFLHQLKLNRFFPQPKVVVNRTNIHDHLIEYQLNMVGKTIEDAKKDDMWFHNFTMTSQQHEMFKSYAIPLLKKVFKFNKGKAEQTFQWFDLGHGLRIKD